MKEQIRQLALQAFMPINDIASEGVADMHTFNRAWFQMYNESFAELIAEVCVNIIENNSKYAQEHNWSINELTDVCVYEIEKTFGDDDGKETVSG